MRSEGTGTGDLPDDEKRAAGVARIVVALVWLYNGLWCKLLARCGGHAAVAGALPGFPGLRQFLLPALGLLEVGLAVWVLTGLRTTLAAAVQTALLVGMNVGALSYARSALCDPGGLIVQNLAFLTLVWTVALRPPARQPTVSWQLLLGDDPPETPAPAGDVPTVRFLCVEAASYLESCAPASFDAFTISNILDGCPAAYGRRLLRAVRHAARPGAPVLVRSFAEPEDSASAMLAASDRSFLWGAIRRLEAQAAG